MAKGRSARRLPPNYQWPLADVLDDDLFLSVTGGQALRLYKPFMHAELCIPSRSDLRVWDGAEASPDLVEFSRNVNLPLDGM